MALDPKKLLPTRRGPRMHSMQRWIFGRCTQVGLDIKRQVIRRLDKNCGARVMLLPGDGLTPRVVYSFQARSRRLARELVQDLQKALIAARRARIRQLESGPVLEIDSPGFGRFGFRRPFGRVDSIYLAAAGDAVHVTFDLATMRMVQGTKSQSRQARARRDATVRQHLRRLGAWDKKVAGIFAADLGSIADRVLGRKDGPEKGGPDKGGAHHKDQGKSNTRAGLFGMHAGYFTVEQGLVRLEVFSPR